MKHVKDNSREVTVEERPTQPHEIVVHPETTQEGDALEGVPAKSSLPQRLMGRFTEALFLPARYDFSDRLRKPWFIISVLLLLLLAVMSIPPVQVFTLHTYPEFQEWLRGNAQGGKLWLESVTIFLEIGVAVCVGGSIIGTALTLTEPIQSKVEQLQKDLDGSIKSRAQRLEDYFTNLPNETAEALRRIVKSLHELRSRTSYLNFFKSIFQLFGLTWDFTVVIQRSLPLYARKLVAVKLLTSFPGGLFGVLTYVLFFLLVAIKVFKLFFDAVG